MEMDALEKRLYGKTPILRGLVDKEGGIRVWCPHCDKHHIHGWPAKFGTRPQHRSAHCTNPESPFNRGGYNIAPFRKKDKIKYKS